MIQAYEELKNMKCKMNVNNLAKKMLEIVETLELAQRFLNYKKKISIEKVVLML